MSCKRFTTPVPDPGSRRTGIRVLPLLPLPPAEGGESRTVVGAGSVSTPLTGFRDSLEPTGGGTTDPFPRGGPVRGVGGPRGRYGVEEWAVTGGRGVSCPTTRGTTGRSRTAGPHLTPRRNVLPYVLFNPHAVGRGGTLPTRATPPRTKTLEPQLGSSDPATTGTPLSGVGGACLGR